MVTLLIRAAGAAGGVDGFGNPVDTPGVPRVWEAWGLAPGVQGEQAGSGGREAVPVEWTVYGPVDGAPSAYDEVQVDGVWLPVNGRPQDWTRGPFGPRNAGVVVELRGVQG